MQQMVRNKRNLLRLELHNTVNDFESIGLLDPLEPKSAILAREKVLKWIMLKEGTQMKSKLKRKALHLESLGSTWERLSEILEVKDDFILPDYATVEPILSPKKCIFIPEKQLIHKMIQAVILLGDQSEGKVVEAFAF